MEADALPADDMPIPEEDVSVLMPVYNAMPWLPLAVRDVLCQTGVRVELRSKALAGLHANDFVLAAKLDRVDVADVVVKKKPQTFLI